jgi:phosphoribosylformimino-5-aminoimidazole carboxamide ribotide isomerase
MTLFRPCIDLHEGRVKQIVGGTLSDSGAGLRTNFVAEQDAAHFARMYKQDGLEGGHVILLGSGNEAAAVSALHAYPLGLQIGGGIDADNAGRWLDAGASQVIVTSWVFPQGKFDEARLEKLSQRVGPSRLVLDLSCRRMKDRVEPESNGNAVSSGHAWRIAMNRWQTITEHAITPAFLDRIKPYCCEFLVHAADVEGLQAGMDIELIRLLAAWGQCPITYAGGARHVGDLELCETASQGRVDLTIGSALDLFGGNGARYADCVAFNRSRGQRLAD